MQPGQNDPECEPRPSHAPPGRSPCSSRTGIKNETVKFFKIHLTYKMISDILITRQTKVRFAGNRNRKVSQKEKGKVSPVGIEVGHSAVGDKEYRVCQTVRRDTPGEEAGRTTIFFWRELL